MMPRTRAVSNEARRSPEPDGTVVSDFYRDVLRRMTLAGCEFLVGGGFAYAHYSGVERYKRDLDLFVRPGDVRPVLALLDAAGYDTELSFPHWLAKIRQGEHVIDVIFSSGNGMTRVDDLWFRHSVAARMGDISIRLCPPEEIIWSKAFVQERERFDGGDVLHLVRALGPTLDWIRLLRRFDAHWRVLFGCVVLFGYVYPADVDKVPRWVIEELTRRFNTERTVPAARVCQGTLLSRAQYQWDISRLGYIDARVAPVGAMTRAQIAIWDAGIDNDDRP